MIGGASFHTPVGFPLLLTSQTSEGNFYMSPSDWAAFAVSGVAVMIALVRLPKHWRNEVRSFDRVPSWWMFSDPLWRGYVRSMPLDIAAGAIGVLSFLPLLLAVSSPSRESLSWIAVSGIGLAFLFLFLGLGVMFFNRPNFACPPALRDQPGALAEWRENRRKRRARRRRSRVG